MNLEINQRSKSHKAAGNAGNDLQFNDHNKPKPPKKGVSRHLTHILKPINDELGGKAIQKSLYTTNGFNKIKFDHDCFEK